MSWMPWRNRRSACPYRQLLSDSLITRLLQLLPDEPGNEQSCVVRRFSYRSLFASIDHWTATPRGVTHAPGMCLMHSVVIGRAQCAVTSFVKDLLSASLFALTFADWWLPLLSMYSMSVILSSSVIGRSGYFAPKVSVSLILCHKGCRLRSGSMICVGLNSEPYDRIVFGVDWVAVSRLKSCAARSMLLLMAASFDRSNCHLWGWRGGCWCFSISWSVAGMSNQLGLLLGLLVGVGLVFMRGGCDLPFVVLLSFAGGIDWVSCVSGDIAVSLCMLAISLE